MTFRVGMIIDGDAAGALRAMEAAERGARRLRETTGGLTGATDRLARSQRSTTAVAAVLPPRLDQIAAASRRATDQIQRLPPALRASAEGTTRLVTGLRNTASTVALMNGPLSGIASRFSNLATIMSRLPPAAGAGVVALGAMTFAAGRGIRVFADYERQLLTVEQVIRATGGAAGRSVRDIDRLSLGIARGTLASARQVRAAAAQLLTFRSIAGDTFDRTLTVAQDLAAVGFGSVEQAAVQLAKALEDPEQGLTALRRVGVSFSAAQIEMIRNFQETGRVAEAQAAILAQVEAQVGGSGVAAADGLAGAFDTLTGEMSRFFELAGREAARLTWLEEIMRGIGEGARRWNQALDVDPDAREIERLRGLRDLTLDQADWRLAGRSPDSLSARERQRYEALLADAAEFNDRILEIQRRRDAEEEALAQQSRDAQAQLAEERRDAVISALEGEIEAARRSAVENEVLTAQRRAGVEAASAEGQQIAELVRQKHAEAEATAAAARAQDEVRRERERGQAAVQNLIGSLRQELDVLRAADPVMAAMIRQRQALAGATWLQRAAVLALTQAVQEEQRAQAFGDELDGLRFDTAAQGMSELQRRQATAARRLGVDLDSPEGRELSETIRLNYEAEQARRQREAAQRAGARASRRERDAAAELIAQLELERDLLRETDPVQQELIRHRQALADATEAQRAQVTELIAEIERETAAVALLDERWGLFSTTAFDAIDDLIVQGRSLDEVMQNVARAIQRAALQAALLGTGPLAGMFGMQAGGGGLLGVLGGLIGIQPRAAGGIIHGPGGPRDDRVAMTARPGDYIVNAAATARNRALLEAIRGGSDAQVPVLASPGEFHMPADLAAPHLPLLEAMNAGAELGRFAQGGMVRGIPMGPPRLGQAPAAKGAAVQNAAGAAAPVYHFHVQTPDPERFARSRATVARGARQLVAMADRFG